MKQNEKLSQLKDEDMEVVNGGAERTRTPQGGSHTREKTESSDNITVQSSMRIR